MLKDVEDYFSKVNWRLNNTEFYKEILNDPTEANRKKVGNIINELKSARLWNKKIATKLEFQEEKTLEFYMLPNVHIQENLGRSVIGSINCSTSSTFRYVDHNPQPHVKKLKCCIKDSTDFIKKMKNLGKIPENSILITMDASLLYTYIQYKKASKKVETTLKRNNKPTRVIITF